MPQIKSQFTTEGRIAFEEKYNLWVYSHEAMIELLMQQDKKIQQLEERLMEVAEYLNVGKWEDWIVTWSETLADKWK